LVLTTPLQVTLAATSARLAWLPEELEPESATVDGASTPASQAANATLVTVVPFAVLQTTVVSNSAEAVAPWLSAAQDVAAAAAWALLRDWESAASVVLADIAMATTPAALAFATALESAAPEEEVEVTDTLAWAAAPALHDHLVSTTALDDWFSITYEEAFPDEYVKATKVVSLAEADAFVKEIPPTSDIDCVTVMICDVVVWFVSKLPKNETRRPLTAS